MLNQQQELRRRIMEILSMEDLVPKDHLLRQIDGAVAFIHIYDFVEELYCKDNGHPSVDPVVLFKIVMIQHLFGITSLRRTMEEIKVNVAYRWFLGYGLSDELPHFWFIVNSWCMIASFAPNTVFFTMQRPTEKDTGNTKAGAISAKTVQPFQVYSFPELRKGRYTARLERLY